MPIYRSLLYPLLARTDPEWAHHRAVEALRLAQAVPGGTAMLARIAGKLPGETVTVAGLHFPNVLGMAAGFDKDVHIAPGLAALGFGHIEVGTITPRPQVGNPKPRIFRLRPERALINRMGFPNPGLKAVLPRLQALSHQRREWVLGVSIGKQKETRLEDAADDYEVLLRMLYRFGDYFAVNISSPNTSGLRDLQSDVYLRRLLDRIIAERDAQSRKAVLPKKPIFLKIAPDLTDEELHQIVDAALECGIEGIIATNTTLSRDGVTGKLAAETGGLSGAPLRQRSTAMVATVARQVEGRIPIIGVGGIETGEHIAEKIAAGASLVQIYTSFVYEGPAVAGRILREYAAISARATAS